jgi:4-aminobutyrate aminotransferase-like enzyme/Ser/Thr protein kinase RdoA (MazF antagonist)
MSAIRSVSPQFSSEDAIEIAKRLYGLTDCVRELPSERDQNFLFRNPDGREFTLKIANRDEKEAVLDMQNRAIEHVGNSVRVIPATDGSTIGTAEGHFVRLVTFLPGLTLADYRPHTSPLLMSFGAMLGRTDQALASFRHEAADRDLYWDIRNAPRVIADYSHLIPDVTRRQMIESVMRHWQHTVTPRLPLLRTSVIHNDANDHNVIVGDANGIGLIDFGDMLETWTVSEPAIACAYAMLHKADPVGAAADVIRGYHSVFPLTEVEIELMYHFIRARLALSVSISAHQKRLEPDNAYLHISEKPAWSLLEKLDTVPVQLAHYVFRDACGLPACPRSGAVVSFLKQEETFGRVVETDLSGDKAVVLDLSIASLDIGTAEDAGDPVKMTRDIFRRLEDRNAEAGIGRYDEPRGLYTSHLFATQSNEGLEWRTIHLGIDLFLPAGAPIYAPLDGTVHSFRNNDQPLDYGPTIILRHETTGGTEFFTLYGHLSLDSLHGLTPGQTITRGERLAWIGNYSVNGGWPPHLHFQIVTDMLEREGEFPGVATPSLRAVWLSLSPDPNLILRIPSGKFPKDLPLKEETRRTRREILGPNLSLAYNAPLQIVRGSGAYLYDEAGRGYLDCVNNVAHVGHCHRRVVEAAQRQIAVLNTNTRYLHDNIVEYARRLTAKLPPRLSVCYFVNSGSEANDLALRMARTYTNSIDTLVIESAYHGNLTSLVEISPYKFDGPGGSGRPSHVHKITIDERYRGGLKRPTFIAESILSCAGQVVLPDRFLEENYRRVREDGGVCIADEVQVGFGRVGTHFWGFETQGVVPDIVTLGKSIGNGHPLGAVVTTPEIAAAFNNGMEYFNTFGGNPVSCAVGLAVLDVIEDENLQSRALGVGAALKAGLLRLASDHAYIRDVRGLGLFLGIELNTGARTDYVIERMKTRGVLLSSDGPMHNVIKIKPPLAFSQGDADFVVASFDEIFHETPLRR